MIKQVRALDVDTTCGALGRTQVWVSPACFRGSVEARADAAGSRAGDAMGGPGPWTFPDRPHPGSPSQGKAAQLTAARSPLLLWSPGQSLRAEGDRDTDSLQWE